MIHREHSFIFLIFFINQSIKYSFIKGKYAKICHITSCFTTIHNFSNILRSFHIDAWCLVVKSVEVRLGNGEIDYKLKLVYV